MLSTRFKYFEISNQNRFIFISKNKILYDIDNNSYIFDAKNLLIEGNEEENQICNICKGSFDLFILMFVTMSTT